MLNYMHVQCRNSSVPCTCKKVSYYENHWGTTGMPEIILIHTCTLCILGFSSQKRKGKEDKLPDILSNKEGPTVQGLKQLKTGQLMIYLCQF